MVVEETDVEERIAAIAAQAEQAASRSGRFYKRSGGKAALRARMLQSKGSGSCRSTRQGPRCGEALALLMQRKLARIVLAMETV
jgi:hypothetical protein